MISDVPFGMSTTPSSTAMDIRHETTNELETFQNDFQRDLQAVLQLVAFKPDTSSASDLRLLDQLEPSLSSMSSQISRVEDAIHRFRSYVQAESAQLSHISDLQRRVALQTRRVAAIKKTMPPEVAKALDQVPVYLHIPTPVTAATPASSTHRAQMPGQAPVGDMDVENDAVESTPPAPPSPSPSPSPHKKQASHTRKGVTSSASASARPPVQKSRGTRSRTGDTTASSAGAKENGSRGSPRDGSLKVRSATEHELSAAPQYVRGRLTLESLDKVAQKLTEIAISKYEILRKPNSALSPAELAHNQAFREAMCDETNGKKFITEAEIKGFGEYRIDSTVKNGINVLRHIGSLKEVRGKNRTRIFIINGSD